MLSSFALIENLFNKYEFYSLTDTNAVCEYPKTFLFTIIIFSHNANRYVRIVGRYLGTHFFHTFISEPSSGIIEVLRYVALGLGCISKIFITVIHLSIRFYDISIHY